MKQQQDDVPLTPVVVDCVTFDRAPLGRRGYNEDQVDDFLDRVQATLAGTDSLKAQQVREVIFDSAPLIRRGYHEEQVDNFLDLVVEEFERRERGGVPAPAARPAQPGQAAPGTSTPGHSAPGQVVPGQATSSQAAPGQAAPGHGAPGQGVPGHGAPGHGGPGRGAPGLPGPGRPGPRQRYPEQPRPAAFAQPPVPSAPAPPASPAKPPAAKSPNKASAGKPDTAPSAAEEAARSAAALRAAEVPLAEATGAAIADTSSRTQALPKRRPGATERPGPLRPVPLDHHAAPRGPGRAADKTTNETTDKAADKTTGTAAGTAAEDEPLVVDAEVVEEWADEELEPVDAEIAELEDPPEPDEEGLSVPTSLRAPGSGPSMGSRLTAAEPDPENEPAGAATKIVPAIKPDTPLSDEPEPTLPSPAPAARVDSPDAPLRSRPGTSPTAGQPDARPGTSPTAGQPEGAPANGAPEAPWQHVTAPTPRLSPAGGLAGLAQPGTPPPGAPAGLAPGAQPTQAGRRLAPGSDPGHYAGGQPMPGGRRHAPGGQPAPGGRPGGQPMPGGHLPAAGLADPATGARPTPPGTGGRPMPPAGARPMPPGGQPGPGGWGPPHGPGNAPPSAFGGLPAGFTPAVPNGEMPPPPPDAPAAQAGPAVAPPRSEPPQDDEYDDHDDQYDDEYDEPTTGDAVRAAVDAWRDSDVLALPLPPAPPGERGYRPGDVEKLINLLADALDDTDNGPRPDDLAGLKLSRTFFIGQGYHIGAVEALRSAWISELKRREL
jgi:DivIVA domain-containing protein